MIEDLREPRLRRVGLTPAERQSMTSAVLARTTGNPCRRAASLLAGRPDQPLPLQIASLLDGHLDHCAHCRALAASIRDTRDVLAQLVELEAGAEFAAGVVRATTGRLPWEGRRNSIGLVSLWAWGSAWRLRASIACERLLARPRLSLELAYVATVIAVLLVGSPSSIAGAVGSRARTINMDAAGSVVADLVRWFDRHISESDQTEPTKPPVRVAQ